MSERAARTDTHNPCTDSEDLSTGRSRGEAAPPVAVLTRARDATITQRRAHRTRRDAFSGKKLTPAGFACLAGTPAALLSLLFGRVCSPHTAHAQRRAREGYAKTAERRQSGGGPICKRYTEGAKETERGSPTLSQNPLRTQCDKEAGVAENTHGSRPCFRTQVPDQLQILDGGMCSVHLRPSPPE